MSKKLKFARPNRKSMRYRGTECLNCGQPLDKSDRFCSYCSQENSNKQLSASDYFMQFIGSILVYDSRLRHTIRELLFKPGLVSKNYVAGQRLKYANPFRFFLSVSIIFFLLKGLLPSVFPLVGENTIGLNIEDAQIAADSSTTKIPSKLYLSGSRGDTLTAQKIGITQYFSEASLDTLSFSKAQIKRTSLYLEYHFAHPHQSVAEALTMLHHNLNSKNRWLYTRAIAGRKVSENPQDFSHYLSSKIPFFPFLFRPCICTVFQAFLFKNKTQLHGTSHFLVPSF